MTDLFSRCNIKFFSPFFRWTHLKWSFFAAPITFEFTFALFSFFLRALLRYLLREIKTISPWWKRWHITHSLQFRNQDRKQHATFNVGAVSRNPWLGHVCHVAIPCVSLCWAPALPCAVLTARAKPQLFRFTLSAKSLGFQAVPWETKGICQCLSNSHFPLFCDTQTAHIGLWQEPYPKTWRLRKCRMAPHRPSAFPACGQLLLFIFSYLRLLKTWLWHLDSSCAIVRCMIPGRPLLGTLLLINFSPGL